MLLTCVVSSCVCAVSVLCSSDLVCSCLREQACSSLFTQHWTRVMQLAVSHTHYTTLHERKSSECRVADKLHNEKPIQVCALKNRKHMCRCTPSPRLTLFSAIQWIILNASQPFSSYDGRQRRQQKHQRPYSVGRPRVTGDVVRITS